LCDNPKQIAEGFNNFFTHIGPILDQKIPKNNTSQLNSIPGNYAINLTLQPATVTEIDRIIDNLKNCAVGWDLLPAIIFKENKEPLSHILQHIVNLSLEQGTFPSKLKLANIIPIFKAGDSEVIGNYRPVSLLSTVSKVFERAFFTRLSTFINHQQILYSLQFGFREGHATDMAIIKLLENIIDSLEKGDYTATIFLDFQRPLTRSIMQFSSRNLTITECVVSLMTGLPVTSPIGDNFVLLEEKSHQLQKLRVGCPRDLSWGLSYS
jgi:hypothetical protein